MMHGMLKQVNTRINKRFGLIRKMRVRKVWLALIDVLTQRQTLDWYHSAPKSGRGFLFQWAVMSMLKAEWVEHLRRRMRCWFRRTCFWFQGVFAKINYFEAIHYVALMFMVYDQMSWIKTRLQRPRPANEHISFALHRNISNTTFSLLNIKKN